MQFTSSQYNLLFNTLLYASRFGCQPNETDNTAEYHYAVELLADAFNASEEDIEAAYWQQRGVAVTTD